MKQNFLIAFFKSLWTKFEPEAEKALVEFEEKITPDVYKLAEDAVLAVSSLGGGTTARNAAIAKLKTDAEATGIDVKNFAENELNALIELVYISVKSKATAAATDTGAGTTGDTTTGEVAGE